MMQLAYSKCLMGLEEGNLMFLREQIRGSLLMPAVHLRFMILAQPYALRQFIQTGV